MTSSLKADPDFEYFLLNEEETRILLAIQELKQQLTYVNEEQFEIVQKEIEEQLDLYEKNIKSQISSIKSFLSYNRFYKYKVRFWYLIWTTLLSLNPTS